MNDPKPRRQRRRPPNNPREGPQIRTSRPPPAHRKPRSTQNSLPTTTLDVVDFTVTRALELRSLRQATNQNNGNRRVYQQLSWHARRRTMSHSSHRMPARLRLAHAAQLSNQGALKPPGPRGKARLRKYRRKARFLKAIRRLRSHSQKWMETHIWHAKRFRMSVVGEKKVAESCNDRGYRSAYRAANRACVICDVSYHETLQITGDLRKIKDVLRQHMSFEDGRRATTDPVTSGMRWATDVVILDAARAIAPCDLLWRPSTPTVWLWTRPEAAQSIASALAHDGIAISRLSQPPLRFRFIGPRSGPILGSVLDSSTPGMNFISHSRDSRCLPSGSVFTGMTQNPRLSFPPKTVGMHVAQVGNCGDASDVFKTVDDSPLWESSVRESLRVRARTANKVNNFGEKSDIPFILLQHSAPPGYDLLVPPGWGCPFWISLMYANNSRAIGTGEHGLLRMEHLQPTFPEDYPDSSVAEKVLKSIEEELRAGYNRKPKGKRVNYERYGISSPWFPDLVSVARNEVGIGREKRLKVGEIVVARGRAKLGALLGSHSWILGDARGGMQRNRRSIRTRPEESRSENKVAELDGENGIDMELCTSFARVVLRAGRGVPQQCGVICEPLPSDFKNGVQEEFGVGGSCRRVIGYIVRGGYSISEGVGIGVGFVAVSSLRRLIGSVKSRRAKVRVLFRNTSSLCYRQAELGILEA